MASSSTSPSEEDIVVIDDGDDAPPQEFCVAKGVGAAISGGIMGAVFGTGAGLVQRKSFKGAFAEGGTSAKTFAIMSAVHSLVTCYMKKLRGREDALNAGIAGCATGLALGWGGTPQTLLQGCLGFGAFSYIFDFMNPPVAQALGPKRPRRRSSQTKKRMNPAPLLAGSAPFVLPPFTLPPLSLPWLQSHDLPIVKDLQQHWQNQRNK
eukprot:TRINITY_DN17155_c0_g1_i1.p1 TRINITY_DN17155_c0_g1~~TRINITY_DN17155_c0_g1_i1.p1  ORF type:complete len:208 (+),score=41.80 TRINITY_DN17155_c0_g1_i1:118-741(+)